MIDWKLRVGDIRQLGFVPWAILHWKRLLVWGIVTLAVVAVVVKVTPATKTYHTEYRSERDPDTGTYTNVPVQIEDTEDYKRLHAHDRDLERGRSSSSWGNTGDPIMSVVLDHIQENWKSELVAFLFGVLLGWFLLRWLLLAFVGAIVITMLATGLWPFYLIAGFIVGVVIAALFARHLAGGHGGWRKNKNTEFGTAEWATLEHLQEKKLIGKDGYLLGYFQKDGEKHPISYTGDRHLLTVAPTRAGKGVSAIIPNLLMHKGSAVVIDPKGENAMVTARQRKALGQAVHVLDPWGVTEEETATFNPLEWLKPDDQDIGENALMLADAMVTRSGGENSFWDEEAVGLLWGLILFVALDRRDGNPGSLGDVRDLINLGPEPLSGLLEDMQKHPNLIVRSTAERTLAKEEKTRASVFTTLQSHTHFLDSPRMRASLASSPRTFRFEDLKEKPTTIYLVLPADRLQPFGRWLRLLVQQAITVNARNIKVKPVGGRPILFLLDEMAALGRLTKVEEAYGLMAGFGMQLWGIVQDLGQLDRIYNKGWETFIGNSGVLQYFGSRDEKTASYFSKLAGVSTIEKFSITRNISRTLGISSSSGQGGASSGSSDSTTTGTAEAADVIQRPLAFPDELMRMSAEKSLVLVETFNPIDARKIEWFTDAAYRELGVDIRKPPAPLPGVQSRVRPAAARLPAAQPAQQMPPPGDVTV